MQVGELFLALGLNVDQKQWTAGQAAIQGMAAALIKLGTDAARAEDELKKLKTPPAVKTNLEKIAGSGDRVGSAFWRMAEAAAAFFAVDKLKDWVEGTAKLGKAIEDTSEKTGIGAEDLQKWGYAASLNSSSMEGVADGAKKLSKGLQEVAQTGSGPAADGFRMLGISMQDPAIKSRNLDQILYLVANQFSQMPDGAKKTAIAMDLFGRSGADLIPLLNKGVQGIKAYGAEADRLGLVMSGDAVDGLAGLDESLTKVHASFDGLKNQALAAILPEIQSLVDSLLDWVAANKDLIKEELKAFLLNVVDIVKALSVVVGFAIKHWKALGAVFATLAVVSGIMKIVKAIAWFTTAQAAAAGEAAIAWVAILGPILLVAAAVLGIGYLIYTFRDKIWAALQAVGGFFSDLAGTVADIFKSIWGTITSTAETVWDALKSGFSKAFDFISNLPVVRNLLELVAALQGLTRDPTAAEQKKQDDVRGAFANPWAMFGSGDGGTPDAAQYTGATGGVTGVPASRTAPVAGAGAGGATVTNSYSVQINAGAASAKEVGDMVGQQLREHDERTRRQTAASLGV